MLKNFLFSSSKKVLEDLKVPFHVIIIKYIKTLCKDIVRVLLKEALKGIKNNYGNSRWLLMVIIFDFYNTSNYAFYDDLSIICIDL